MTTRAQPEFALRSLVPSVYLPAFLFAVGQGAILPIIPLFAKDLGASLAIAGLMVAVRGIGVMAMDLPGGLLISRFGEKAGMASGMLFVGVIALAAAQSPSPAVLGVLMLLMGAGWSFWQLARLSYVSHVVPNQNRGRAIALVGGVTRGGNAVGPVIGGLVAESLGLEFAFYAQAVTAAAAAGIILISVSKANIPVATAGHSVREHLRSTVHDHRKVLFTLGAPIITLTVIRQARQIFLPLWGDELELGLATIGFVYGLSQFVDTSLFYPVGIAMDRWGRKWTAVPALVCLALCLLVLPTTSDLYGFTAVALLAGFGNGLSTGIVMTLGADLAPVRGRAEFLSVWRLIGDVGTAGGPLTISLITGVVSLAAASVFSGGLGLVGALVMAFFVRETLQRGGRPPDDVPEEEAPTKEGSVRGS